MNGHDPHDLDAPADVVPRRSRPDKATVTRVLNGAGQTVTWRESRVIEDVDGIPNGIETTERTGTLVAANLASLGWTQAEYDDPTITD